MAGASQSGQLTLRGGTVVTAGMAVQQDVAMRDGKIVAMGNAAEWTGSQNSLDVTGCYVFPGGVDAHTHIEYESALPTTDDFAKATVAAALGGTTTVIDFARRLPGFSLYDSYQERLRQPLGAAVIDYSFHAMITASGLTDNGAEDMIRLADEGVTSFKVLMAYPGRMMVDDGTILEAMDVAASLGLLITVHAENGHMVTRDTQQLVEANNVSERMHLHAHTDLAEGEAATRAIALSESTGASLCIVHVSSRSVVEALAQARARGVPVWGETCTQYLAVAYEDYEDMGPAAAKYICTPPIRERENQEYLWAGLRSGALSTVATDHAVFTWEEGQGSKASGSGSFTDVPGGVPGVEERLSVLYETGVNQGRISLSRFVDLIATAPAKLFGLFPQKGVVAVGSDADLVVWDPDTEKVLTATDMHSGADYTLYEGMRVRGQPRFVISRGELIVSEGELQAEPGRGRYLRRSSPSLELV